MSHEETKDNDIDNKMSKNDDVKSQETRKNIEIGWLLCGKKMKISKATVKYNTGWFGEGYSTVYGKQEVASGITEWKIKITQKHVTCCIFIGISASINCTDNQFCGKEKTCDLYNYGYNSFGYKESYNTSLESYGSMYGTNDVITITLNQYNQTISFHKNGVPQWTAFTNIVKAKYRLAVNFWGFNVSGSIQMLSCYQYQTVHKFGFSNKKTSKYDIMNSEATVIPGTAQEIYALISPTGELVPPECCVWTLTGLFVVIAGYNMTVLKGELEGAIRVIPEENPITFCAFPYEPSTHQIECVISDGLEPPELTCDIGFKKLSKDLSGEYTKKDPTIDDEKLYCFIELTFDFKSVYVSGFIGVIQLVFPNREYVTLDDKTESITTDFYVLDGIRCEIADGKVFYADDIQDINSKLVVCDQPAVFLNGYKKVSCNDKFKTYLMYKYDAPDSVWIPVCQTIWEWHASAHLNVSDNKWYFDYNSMRVQADTHTDWPIWDGNIYQYCKEKSIASYMTKPKMLKLSKTKNLFK
eukprot:259897_1